MENISKWYYNGVLSNECGICSSKYHCTELCDKNRSITKLHHTTSLTCSTENDMLPVLLQASYITSSNGPKLGALWDLCSTDSYITFKKAKELRLKGKEVVLTIEGVGGSETTHETKLYDVPVYFKKKKKGREDILLSNVMG